MKTIFKSVCLALPLIGFAQTTIAAQSLQVWGRAYHHSCGYYSSTDADFDITIFDDSLPYGSSVTLVSGFGSDMPGRDPNTAHWQFKTERKMEAISASTWRVRRSGQINTRSGQRVYNQIEFVLRIDEPGKESRWVSPSGAGTYFVSRIDYQRVQCVTGPDDLPRFAKFEISTAP